MQVTYVQPLLLGENTVTNIYQWDLTTHQIFTKKKEWFIYWIWVYPCVHRRIVFVSTKVEWEYHVQKWYAIINKRNKKELKCNTKKYLFRQTEMEYLGFWVTHNGVKPINKNPSNKKYYATNLSKISTSVYRCSELLPQ